MPTTTAMTDIEIIRVAKSFTKGILDGRPTKDMCHMVCSPLQNYLAYLGIECELTEGDIKYRGNEWHHFWITLKDGRIIDPTADQFYVNNEKSKLGYSHLKNVWLRRLSYYKSYTAKDINDKITEAVRKFAEKTKP